MYEFSEKDIRNKFKKTKYGKKINKMLYVSLVVSLILFAMSCVIYFFMGSSDGLSTSIKDAWLNILFGITSISVIISCYFDGKRDGAIEQYKISIKK